MILYSKDTKSDLSVNLWIFFFNPKMLPDCVAWQKSFVFKLKMQHSTTFHHNSPSFSSEA